MHRDNVNPAVAGKPSSTLLMTTDVTKEAKKETIEEATQERKTKKEAGRGGEEAELEDAVQPPRIFRRQKLSSGSPTTSKAIEAMSVGQKFLEPF